MRDTRATRIVMEKHYTVYQRSGPFFMDGLRKFRCSAIHNVAELTGGTLFLTQEYKNLFADETGSVPAVAKLLSNLSMYVFFM